MKYSLQQINDISSSEFTFEIPDDTFNMINYLCTNVGSSILVTNIYQNISCNVEIVSSVCDRSTMYF